MTEQIEETRIEDHEGHQHRQRIVVDTAASSRRTAYRVSSFIWVLFGLLTGAIGLRVFLMLIGANPENPFARLVYAFTGLFLWPFFGLTSTPGIDGKVLDVPALVAMIVYLLIGWAVVKLTALLLLRP
jgi:hypothetical protein